jgi:hypothetical protein
MEALAAVGLAANILQFIDFSYNIISGHIWGGNLQRIDTTWLTRRESNHSPDFLCGMVYSGLHQFRSPDLMSHLKLQYVDSGANLLLVAAL